MRNLLTACLALGLLCMTHARSVPNEDEYLGLTVTAADRFVSDGGWVSAGYSLNCTGNVTVYPTFDAKCNGTDWCESAVFLLDPGLNCSGMACVRAWGIPGLQSTSPFQLVVEAAGPVLDSDGNEMLDITCDLEMKGFLYAPDPFRRRWRVRTIVLLVIASVLVALLLACCVLCCCQPERNTHHDQQQRQRFTSDAWAEALQDYPPFLTFQPGSLLPPPSEVYGSEAGNGGGSVGNGTSHHQLMNDLRPKMMVNGQMRAVASEGHMGFTSQNAAAMIAAALHHVPDEATVEKWKEDVPLLASHHGHTSSNVSSEMDVASSVGAEDVGERGGNGKKKKPPKASKAERVAAAAVAIAARNAAKAAGSRTPPRPTARPTTSSSGMAENSAAAAVEMSNLALGVLSSLAAQQDDTHLHSSTRSTPRPSFSGHVSFHPTTTFPDEDAFGAAHGKAERASLLGGHGT